MKRLCTTAALAGALLAAVASPAHAQEAQYECALIEEGQEETTVTGLICFSLGDENASGPGVITSKLGPAYQCQDLQPRTTPEGLAVDGTGCEQVA